MNDLKALGEMLRNARSQAGLTLREVEGKTKISNAYLSQVEGAKIKQPSPAILHKLCDLYGCSYAAALEMAGYPIPNGKQQPVDARFVARLGKTTSGEQESILEYLQFLRSRKR
jgi:HTH-type transcriptional regulator, competence development regulator